MRKFGPLNALDEFNDENADWAIVFHGYGADAFDLFPLRDLLRLSKPINWIFPQGPLEIPIGPGWTGRAWWNIDIEKIQRDSMAGIDRDLSQEKSEAAILARNKVLSMIESLKVPWSKIILAGFSQGAMLATDVFMQAPQNPKALVLWSGALVNKEEWKVRSQSEEFRQRMSAKPSATFYQSHGAMDTVLTIKNAQRLEGFLQSIGLKGKLVTFPGGHEIPPQILQQTKDYLISRI